MNSPSQEQDPGPLEQRFELAVWPQTPARPWRAEVRARGDGVPRGFERPMDLVLYLTQLSDCPHQQRGLR
jgi:hypothetical protein